MKRRREGQDWYGKISYQEFEEELNDPAIVEKKIREGTTLYFSGKSIKVISLICFTHQDDRLCFLSPAQDEMAGVGVGICDDLITLEIASPDVPDLTLIDLPGIARVAVKGQPENIGDQVSIVNVFLRICVFPSKLLKEC